MTTPPKILVGEKLRDVVLSDGSTHVSMTKADGYPIYLHRMFSDDEDDDTMIETFTSPHLEGAVFVDMETVWAALEDCGKLDDDK